MGDPVAAAERLSHRVAEAQAGACKRRSRVHCPLEQLAPCIEVAAVGEHARERVGNEGGARERLPVRVRVPAGHVEGLGAVREGVQRGPARLARGKSQRQLRLVDDSLHVRAAAAELEPACLVPDPESRCPFGSRVGRRDGDQR